MSECIFCKVVKGELPTKKVYENDEILAFNDIHPLAPIHVLIIPKKHIEKLTEVKEKDQMLLGEIQLVAAKIAKKLGISESFRVSLCNGAKAGQSVFHLHYHLRGGWKGDAPGIS